MSKYIKSFKTKAEYNTYIAGDHATPYTAYVEEEDKYYYGAKEPEMLEFEFPASPSGDLIFNNTLTSVKIPNGVTSISQSSFNTYYGLTSVSIPNGVTSIPYQCFYYCQNLTDFNIPDTVTSIGQGAFYSCQKITEVVIPSGVTSIDNQAFYQCSRLASVTVLATTPPTLNIAVFSGNASGRKIYVPASSVEAYKAATNWSTYASDIEAIPA